MSDVLSPVREFCWCHILKPILRQLRGGITTRRLAWSLAIGVIIGINPTVGITTLAAILLAWIFRLSKAASLIGAEVVAPLHLLLFLPFIELGVHLFHTHHLPMNRRQLHHLSKHPIRMMHEIWSWEWHALVVWAIAAVVLTPIMAKYLRHALVIFMRRHRALMHSSLES